MEDLILEYGRALNSGNPTFDECVEMLRTIRLEIADMERSLQFVDNPEELREEVKKAKEIEDRLSFAVE